LERAVFTNLTSVRVELRCQ